jgi:3-hydroxymyristoyl/3-hydroxydecanoyl-(acyl carrier protein) dehydratase
MLPGVLIVEALFQAAGLLVAYSLPPDCQANLGLNCGVEDVKIRKSVVPGDQMKLNASLEDGWFRMGRMCIAKVMASKRVEVNRQYMWEAITNSFNIKIGLTSKSE